MPSIGDELGRHGGDEAYSTLRFANPAACPKRATLDEEGVLAGAPEGAKARTRITTWFRPLAEDYEWRRRRKMYRLRHPDEDTEPFWVDHSQHAEDSGLEQGKAE